MGEGNSKSGRFFITHQAWSGIVTSISTIVIVLTTAFYDQIVPRHLNTAGMFYAFAAMWIMLGITIIYGLIISITFIVRRSAAKTDQLDPSGTVSAKWVMVQGASFVGGLLTLAVLAAILLCG